jgi:hypothetical protein
VTLALSSSAIQESQGETLTNIMVSWFNVNENSDKPATFEDGTISVVL